MLCSDTGPLQLAAHQLGLGCQGLAVVELLKDAVQAVAGLGAPGEGGQRAVLGIGAHGVGRRCCLEFSHQGIGFAALLHGCGGGAVAALGPAGVAAAAPAAVEAMAGYGASLQG